MPVHGNNIQCAAHMPLDRCGGNTQLRSNTLLRYTLNSIKKQNVPRAFWQSLNDLFHILNVLTPYGHPFGGKMFHASVQEFLRILLRLTVACSFHFMCFGRVNGKANKVRLRVIYGTLLPYPLQLDPEPLHHIFRLWPAADNLPDHTDKQRTLGNKQLRQGKCVGPHKLKTLGEEQCSPNTAYAT